MWPSGPWHCIHINFAEYEKTHCIILPGGLRFSTCWEIQWWHQISLLEDHLWKLFAKHGMPVDCGSNNRPQFCSERFTYFLKMNDVKHVKVALHHAVSNGLVI